MGNGPNTMSHDRVHFTIPSNLLHKSTIQSCIVEALGLDNKELLQRMARNEEDLHIICRPSQFARWVILRHVKYGEPNNMACLNMRLVTPPKAPRAIDVSHKANNAGGSGEVTL